MQNATPAGTPAPAPVRSIPVDGGSRDAGVSRVIHFGAVSAVSIRDLRNHGGDVVDRVARGERVTITRNGRPVAELMPLRTTVVTRELLIAHRRSLPAVDPAALRRDIDDHIDTSL